MTSLAIALVGYAAGMIPLEGHTLVELIVGGLAAPLFFLIGPGIVIAVALIIIVGVPEGGFSRGRVTVLAVAAGVIWLALFLSPDLLDGRGVAMPQLFALVPWLVFGLVMRNRRS